MPGLIARNKTTAAMTSAVVLLIADRFFKQLALSGYKTNLIPNWLDFNLSYNKYLALSLGPEQNVFVLSFLSLIIIGLVFTLLYSLKHKRPDVLPLTFILFGAISNILDRYSHAAVIDYLEAKITTFNISDLMILVGITLYFIEGKDENEQH